MIKGSIKKKQLQSIGQSYRKIEALNQSMIKLFDENPILFFNEVKLGKPRKFVESVATKIGDAVDFCALECSCDESVFLSRLDEKFVLWEEEKGTKQFYNLADHLFDCTIEDTVDGIVKTEFMTRFNEACNRSKADGKYKNKSIDYMLEDFESKGKKYYDFRIKNINKSVIDQFILSKTLKICESLKSDSFTKDIFGSIKSDSLTHFPIIWDYKCKDGTIIKCKSELDLVIIDHNSKTILPFDLKTNYNSDEFRYNYIKKYYYIQASFYMDALEFWKNENGLSDYKVECLSFIVADTSINNRRPVIYITTQEDIDNGKNGFLISGRKYKGYKELIEEINWHEKTDNWNVSKEAFNNKGLMFLNIEYDK